ATQAGTILGTAAYMAPEQARGKNVDKRADIWAFGVVLHELLTGRRLFEGEDLTDTLASVVKEQPDLTVVPPRVRRLLAKCLENYPKRRRGACGDVGDLPDGPPTPAGHGGVERRSAVSPAVFATVAGVLCLALIALAFIHFRETPPLQPILRYSLPV